MAAVKIDVKVGGIHFAGEGDEKWIAAQLDKILDKAISLGTCDDAGAPGKYASEEENGSSKGKATGTLAAFLKSTNSTVNQNRKFLATAQWLHAKGNTQLTTSVVVKAIKESHQSRLGNASENLNQNAKKGHCEKDGKTFYVTDEGRAELGL